MSHVPLGVCEVNGVITRHEIHHAGIGVLFWGEHGGAVGSAVASQLEGPGFDSRS